MVRVEELLEESEQLASEAEALYQRAQSTRGATGITRAQRELWKLQSGQMAIEAQRLRRLAESMLTPA